MLRRHSLLGILLGIILQLSATPASAWECIDCGSKCCAKKFGVKVCVPGCEESCAIANLGCGKAEIPVPGPVDVPPISVDPKTAGDVAVALATGGLVTPASKKLTDDAIREVSKAVADISKNAEKGYKDTVAETGRVGRSLEGAAQAIDGYVKAKTEGTIASVNTSLDRVREGKIVDALWHYGTDIIKVEDQAAAGAAMKSDLIRNVGQVGASVYGGPGGAAAYAAWLTYHQSCGDIELALRVGMIAGATAWATSTTSGMPTTDASGNFVVSETAKKVAVSGAIGGLAIAAAGGDETAVRDGFLRAGAMVIVQEGYKSYIKHPLDKQALEASKGDPYCISTTVNCQTPPAGAARYVDGKFVGWEQSKLDPSAPHVGMGYPDAAIGSADVTLPTEGSALMQGISKIPGMNAMAVFHDQWAMDWSFPPVILQATIYPAIVLTYIGTEAPLQEQIRVVAEKKKSAKNPEPPDQAAGVIIVKTDEVPANNPVDPKRVETSYLCSTPSKGKAGGDITRSILVEVEPSLKGFACRVVYRANDKRTVPHRALKNTDYCEAKARALADAAITSGYKCVVGVATARKVLAAQPENQDKVQ